MKQQTAVEWLWNLSQTKELQASDFEQALAMEKEQIIQAYEYGSNASLGVSKTNLIESLNQPKQ